MKVSVSLLFLTAFCWMSVGAAAQDPFSVILVDKQKNQLHLAEYNLDKIEIRKTFHVTYGKAPGDKEIEGDEKTPEGIYFLTARLKPPSIKKKFGVMALMVNYPNPMDALLGKKGKDIMLHATDDPSRLKKNQDSQGCVVIDNGEIEEISPHVMLGLTPIIIYPEIKPEYLRADGDPGVVNAFKNWLNAWSTKDITNYIASYANSFHYNGMNLKRYQEYKEALNDKYDQISIKADNIRYFYHPKYDAVYFTQLYESRLKNGHVAFKSSGTKVVYFVKDGTTPKIADESFVNKTEE